MEVLPVPIYHVSYDLHRGQDEYPGLWAELEKTPHRHILQSSWLVLTSETARQLDKRLKKHLHLGGRGPDTDRIFISEVDANRQGWLEKETWNWVNANANAGSPLLNALLRRAIS